MTTSVASMADEPKTVQVRVRDLNKSFHRKKESVHVLRDISLEIEEGELLVLLGPSGCGKTTLLRCLVGLEKPDNGVIELGEKTVVDAEQRIFVQPNRRNVSMVFQHYALWPHMKVAKNVAYPLKARGRKQDLQGGRVHEVLKLVQCDHLADRYPPELSGGQQQRVSLARALASRPAVLLLDEPLSNLDALLRIDLRAQLRLLHHDLGFTGVYVTHDQEEALALGTRIAVMKEGQFEQIGPPEEVYRRPTTEYVADFLGARNRLEISIDAQGEAKIAGQRMPGFAKPGMPGDYVLRFRDADLKLRATTQDAIPGADFWLTGGFLQEVLLGGETSEHLVQLDEQRFYAAVPHSQARLEPDTSVDVGISWARTLCYDTGGRLVEGWAP